MYSICYLYNILDNSILKTWTNSICENNAIPINAIMHSLLNKQ